MRAAWPAPGLEKHVDQSRLGVLAPRTARGGDAQPLASEQRARTFPKAPRVSRSFLLCLGEWVGGGEGLAMCIEISFYM